ncbi:hypothetical protein CC78DRAFT_205915 [Lojkania enalia]|uniref:Secreted protein n=1 Tax=Lojkania enalia TaxID=147567 RepID=A0A9P4K001_9PLEO|nr:hypothetical protein CC78DRAFT_205915 [Didymosphaeria enalia]
MSMRCVVFVVRRMLSSGLAGAGQTEVAVGENRTLLFALPWVKGKASPLFSYAFKIFKALPRPKCYFLFQTQAQIRAGV